MPSDPLASLPIHRTTLIFDKCHDVMSIPTSHFDAVSKAISVSRQTRFEIPSVPVFIW